MSAHIMEVDGSSRLGSVRGGVSRTPTCVRGEGEHSWWRDAGRGIPDIPGSSPKGETFYVMEPFQTELEYVVTANEPIQSGRNPKPPESLRWIRARLHELTIQ